MTAKQLKLFELFLVVFVAFAASLIISINYIITGDKIEHVDQIATIVRNIVHTVLSIFLLIYVLHRNKKTLKDIGIKYNISLKDSMGAIGMIFLIIIIQFLLASLMKHFFSGSAHQMTSPKNVDFLQTRYIGLMLIFVIVAPALEELVVRGYLMTEIISLTNNKVLAVIVSVVFQTSYHLYQGITAALFLMPIFIIFSIYFIKTKNLNAILLAHIFIDIFAFVSRL